ncbi:hypothetical protein GUJ93_ZPchr0010g9156 [Zizania palustris]|uniref:DUF1664 domain-containing protein n=1 Tax=Zizania palustris TaxID=103762 RepID=A0A8J5W7Q4_ZIZPA|nr:hypothetical protein GUJ93_ZPchr0010g8948 [Zizania palustris]KAG8084652.1 hypothetical protein GUJ93_ZPchr0010g9156 [Zizania palustris]
MVLGNVAILVGSGILGTVLTSGDAKIPSAGEVLSGAAKFVKKHGKEGKDKDASSNNDVHTAQLLSQVNRLRQEIQYLGSRPVTVVTNAARSGTGTFTITAVVVVGVIGYAYIKWKGWKLSDMMFVTKRGLSDACNVVGSQLDKVSDDVTAARRHLAGRIDRVDITLDETQEIIEGTRDEVTTIHGDLSAFQEDLQSVNLVVRTLESKLVSLEYTQDRTATGISDLVEFTHKMEQNQRANIRQVPASNPPAAIGSSSERIVRRATSLPQPPARLALPTVSPAAEPSTRAEPSQVQPQGVVSRTSSPKEASQGVVSRTSSPKEASAKPSNGASSSSEASTRRFGGLKLPGLGLGFLIS